MDIRAYNREAWNRQVEGGNEWTLPVSSEVSAWHPQAANKRRCWLLLEEASR